MRKRITSLLIVLCMAFSFLPAFSLTVYAVNTERPAGSGTADDPFKIGSVEELLWFRDSINNGTLTVSYQNANLTKDLNLNGATWTPIGLGSVQYQGVFDGGNHIINNFTVSVSDTNRNAGFFSNVHANATIKNLHISGANISSTSSVGGGLIGHVNGGTGRQKNNHLTITNCSFNGTIKSKSASGGLIGSIIAGGYVVISDCYTTGTISSNNQEDVGGFIGIVNSNALVEISTSYSRMNLNGKIDLGGFVGQINSDADVYITDAYHAGTYKSSDTTSTNGTNGGRAVGNLLGYCHTNRTHAGYYADATVKFSVQRGWQAGKDFKNEINLTVNSESTNSSERSVATVASTYTKKEFDLENVWELQDGMPYAQLRTKVNKAEGDDATVTLYTDSTKDINIPDYYVLVDLREVTDDNRDRNNEERMQYSITSENTYSVPVTNIESEDYPSKTVTLATMPSNDVLSINGAVGVGEYPITIKAQDETDIYKDFDISLNAVVKQLVLVPEVLVDSIPYSRSTELESVSITEGWSWVSGSTIPKTSTHSYEAYYAYEDGKADYYDTSLVQAAVATGTISDFTEVTDESGKVTGIKVKVPVTTLKSSETPITKKFVITNADTGEGISGAYVDTEYKDEFINGNHQTDANGELIAELSQGSRAITVSAAGFVTWDDEYEVDGNDSPIQEIDIALTPVRYDEFFAPPVYEKEADGTKTENAIENASVTITKVDSTAAAEWNGGDVTATAAANSQNTVPAGVFMIKNATRGYSSDDAVYANVVMNDGGGVNPVTFEVTYYDSYNSATGEFGNKKEYKLYAKKLTEPRYDLVIDEPKNGGEYYTAKVSLSNLKATIGTFGIRWDPDLFDLVDVNNDGLYPELADGLKYVTGPTDFQDGSTYTLDNADLKYGYYVFTWQTTNDKELDAETAAQDIAVFKFKLKRDKNLITYDSFGIQPFDETIEAKAYKKLYPDDDDYWQYWRYCDDENNGANLGENRIERSKAYVNEIDTKGFFQATKNAALGDPTKAADFVDVMTVLEYGFTINNAVLKFHTYDSATEEDLEGTTIKVFDVTNVLKMFGATVTNFMGRASFPVNIKTAKTSTFAYTAMLDGYWPVPLSGFTEDRPQVNVKTGRVTEVPVPLVKKIYHVPTLKQFADAENEESELVLVTEADLGGEKYAYNGRDYHFRVKAAKGYRITAYPTKAFVYVNGDLLSGAAITPDGNGQFELDRQYLDYATNSNLRDLSAEDYDKVKDDPDYADWSYEDDQPNEDGYRGYNLVIRFDNFAVEELEYFVEGVTNDYGKVSYTNDTLKGELPMTTHAPETEPYNYIMVKTEKSEIDQDTKAVTKAANHKTGTFKFEGIEADDVVDKVFINGLEVDTYNDRHEFTYTFDEVDMDNNITVLFRRGDTPSTDKVMTLVVGEFGFADVSSPVKDSEDSDYNDVMLTRRVYLNPTEKLVFDAHAMIGYELKAVEKEVDGADRVDITSQSVGTEIKTETVYNAEGGTDEVDVTHTTYSVDTPLENEQNITVYVTFGAEGIASPNLFVKAYTAYGKGVVDPAGILIYNKWDSVELDLDADEPAEGEAPWLVTSVKVAEYYDAGDDSKTMVYEYEKPYSDHELYRYDSLQKDMAFGAVFMEKAYTLKGYVDLDQGSVNVLDDINTGALIKFRRLDSNGNEIEKQPLFLTSTTAERNGAEFEIELPAGKWNVYVTKSGYLQYKLTDFTMEEPEKVEGSETEYKVKWFGGTSESDARHIVPYIGSTLAGAKITLADAANVKSGWRQGVSQAVHDMADVTDDSVVDEKDLSFVLFNFNKRIISQDYTNFCDEGSVTVKYINKP